MRYYKKSGGKIYIRGRNTMGALFLNYGILLTVGLIIPSLLTILIGLCWIVINLFIFHFSIRLTKHHIQMQKTFLGIPYRSIGYSFEAVEVPNAAQIYFYNGLENLRLTSLDSFEGDYLDIVHKHKTILEIGNKKTANFVLEALRKGIQELEIPAFATE